MDGFLPDWFNNPFDNVFNDPMTADLAFVNWYNQNNNNEDDKEDDDYER